MSGSVFLRVFVLLQVPRGCFSLGWQVGNPFFLFFFSFFPFPPLDKKVSEVIVEPPVTSFRRARASVKDEQDTEPCSADVYDVCTSPMRNISTARSIRDYGGPTIDLNHGRPAGGEKGEMARKETLGANHVGCHLAGSHVTKCPTERMQLALAASRYQGRSLFVTLS
ncbi:hypothetical protein F4820DRAFT_387465 [Hypoxylon rubiginosum]|uniref:Uncharacterized protein n=1 Tax=Hypoxylon rubiginosum TaxID=110542 RepID=A0ACB9YVK9_9PEZI|nr:hypothetical protein F4820DRAFT_387465 [Hypoxylon rubiginosum]